MTDLPIKIRGLSHPEVPLFDEQGIVTNQEKAFIASSWSHKERANPSYFWVSKRAFHHQFYLGVIVPLIDERPELFRVAYNTEKPDQILGWACVEIREYEPSLGHQSYYYWHQCYVKEDFREYHIEPLLIELACESRPQEFMELINDQRKNTVTKNRISSDAAHSREACSVPTV